MGGIVPNKKHLSLKVRGQASLSSMRNFQSVDRPQRDTMKFVVCLLAVVIASTLMLVDAAPLVYSQHNVLPDWPKIGDRVGPSLGLQY